MEPRPRGANFIRTTTLWQIGLHIAGNPETPYGGNRDMCIVVGSGSGESFRPWLRMATGSAILAQAVAAGDLELAFINPSGLLTQAYRGVGLFSEALPVRVVANYPSWDRFVCAFLPQTGLHSLAEVKARRYPLRLSIREDPTHSTRVLVDQMLQFAGFSLDELVAWGGELRLVGGPGDQRRLDAIAAHQVDAIFDEGIRTWLPTAFEAGYEAITPDEPILTQLEALGWRRVILPQSRYPSLPADHMCIDFGGWPLYTSAALPDETAYDICGALQARADWIPWEEGAYTGIDQVGRDTEATPLDVPLHPGAERWFQEHSA
jgi:TRAP-type uncharacterized transport system substrate-binding protein